MLLRAGHEWPGGERAGPGHDLLGLSPHLQEEGTGRLRGSCAESLRPLRLEDVARAAGAAAHATYTLTAVRASSRASLGGHW